MEKNKVVHNFLEHNGIECIRYSNERYIYKGKKCVVYVYKDHYEVVRKKMIWSTDDLTIYQLIGYLTYYNLIDKNYKL